MRGSRHPARHPRRDLRPRAESELGQDAFDMTVGGSFGDDQPLRDLAIRQATLYKRSHLEFPLGERLRDVAATALRRILADTEHEVDDIVETGKSSRIINVGGQRTGLRRLMFGKLR